MTHCKFSQLANTNISVVCVKILLFFSLQTSHSNYVPSGTSNFFSETRVVSLAPFIPKLYVLSVTVQVNTSYPFSPVSINSPTIPIDSNPMISKPKLTGTPQKVLNVGNY